MLDSKNSKIVRQAQTDTNTHTKKTNTNGHHHRRPHYHHHPHHNIIINDIYSTSALTFIPRLLRKNAVNSVRGPTLCVCNGFQLYARALLSRSTTHTQDRARVHSVALLCSALDEMRACIYGPHRFAASSTTAATTTAFCKSHSLASLALAGWLAGWLRAARSQEKRRRRFFDRSAWLASPPRHSLPRSVALCCVRASFARRKRVQGHHNGRVNIHIIIKHIIQMFGIQGKREPIAKPSQFSSFCVFFSCVGLLEKPTTRPAQTAKGINKCLLAIRCDRKTCLCCTKHTESICCCCCIRCAVLCSACS